MTTDFEKIDSEDYFRMNETFCIWLIKKKKVVQKKYLVTF